MTISIFTPNPRKEKEKATRLNTFHYNVCQAILKGESETRVPYEHSFAEMKEHALKEFHEYTFDISMAGVYSDVARVKWTVAEVEDEGEGEACNFMDSGCRHRTCRHDK